MLDQPVIAPYIRTPRERDDVNLSCSALANPSINDKMNQWSWTFNGSMSGNGNVLMLKNVTTTHSGTYTCYAFHISGTKTVSDILNVLCM